MELRAAAEAEARRQRHEVRARVVGGSAFAGMTTGDGVAGMLTVAVGLAAFEIGTSVEEKRAKPPDRA